MAGSIKETIQKIGQAGMPGLTVGIVTSVSPLQVILKNDAKIQLSAVSLVIPDRLRNRRICTQQHVCYEGCCGDHCIPKPIQSGDEFYMLSINNGKLYYVLDWK